MGKEEGDLYRDLNKNINNLNVSIDRASTSSDNLQNKLIFWTKVMAGAIIVQSIAILVQVWVIISNI